MLAPEEARGALLGGNPGRSHSLDRRREILMKKSIMILLSISFCLLGAQQCGKKADTAIKAAQQAVEEARAEDAPKYAPNEFKSAEETLSSAQQMFNHWSFSKSQMSASDAERQAKLAKKIAIEQKAREQEELARLQAIKKHSTFLPSSSLSPCHSPDAPYDFRQARWGISKSEVLAVENASYSSETDEFMEFNGSFLGHQVTISYQFDETGLIAGLYSFEDQFKSWEETVKFYKFVESSLTKLYGPPIDSSVDFHDYKVENKMVKGRAEFYAYWNICQTRIGLHLDDKNGVYLVYSPKSE